MHILNRLAPCLLLLTAAWGMWAHAESAALLVLHQDGYQLTLIDATTGATLNTRALPTALAGGPQIPTDATQVYWGTAEGDILQLSLPDLTVTGHASAGVGMGMPQLALSSDGRWLLAAGAHDPAVQILDDRLQPIRRMTIASPDGREHARATQVLALAERSSWLLALDPLRELWEISWDSHAPPIYDGLVHDYRMGEALPKSGFLGIRRIPLPAPLPDLLVPPGTRLVVGTQACTPPAPCTVRLLHLDTRSQITAWTVTGQPRPSASATWKQGQQLLLALAGTSGPATPIRLPQGQPSEDPSLPADLLCIIHVPAAGPDLWLQRANGAWLQLNPDTLQVQAQLAGTPQTRLLPLPGRIILVTPGPQSYISLHDSATTLVEHQRLPFNGLRGAWVVHLR